MDNHQVLPLSKPKIGVAGKTGFWRSLTPIIDHNKCVKCLLCVVLCPEASIVVEQDSPKILYEYCKGCGICAEECPVKAISMVSGDEVDT